MKQKPSLNGNNLGAMLLQNERLFLAIAGGFIDAMQGECTYGQAIREFADRFGIEAGKVQVRVKTQSKES